jgi:hypothetical protein
MLIEIFIFAFLFFSVPIFRRAEIRTGRASSLLPAPALFSRMSHSQPFSFFVGGRATTTRHRILLTIERDRTLPYASNQLLHTLKEDQRKRNESVGFKYGSQEKQIRQEEADQQACVTG